MRITDSHQHFWRRSLFDGTDMPPEQAAVLVRDFQPQDLVPILDAEGVSETVFVMDVPAALSTTRASLALAEANPRIGAIVGWADLTSPAVGDVLDEFCEYPVFKGLRHQWETEADPAWIMRPDVLRGLRELEARDLTFDLLAKPPNWPYITQVAASVPDLRMVLDHIGKPNIRQGQFDDWAQVMRKAAQFPQLMVKLSGMISEADWKSWKPADLRPYVTTVIKCFGVERVMFGSDWPVCLLAGTYHQVLAALRDCLSDLSTAEQAMVLGENARAFYDIV